MRDWNAEVSHLAPEDQRRLRHLFDALHTYVAAARRAEGASRAESRRFQRSARTALWGMSEEGARFALDWMTWQIQP